MERLSLKVAVYIILIKNDSVLLGRRCNARWQNGSYGLPSGHLEAEETIVEATIRETKEETGVELRPEDIEFVHVMHRQSSYTDFFFTAKKWAGEPQIMEKDKCDDIGWFPLDNLPENIIPSVKLVLEHYQKGILFSEFHSED